MIRGFHIGTAQEVIHTDLIKIRQNVEGSYRHIELIQLIIRIGCLVNLQDFRQVFLLEILILTQITQSIFVHNITRFTLYIRLFPLLLFKGISLTLVWR